MTFSCAKCGELEEITIDGCVLADRLLEGVTFRITKKDDNLSAKVIPEHEEYFEQFNQTMWLEKALDCVEPNAVAFSCSKCGDDVEIAD